MNKPAPKYIDPAADNLKKRKLARADIFTKVDEYLAESECVIDPAKLVRAVDNHMVVKSWDGDIRRDIGEFDPETGETPHILITPARIAEARDNYNENSARGAGRKRADVIFVAAGAAQQFMLTKCNRDKIMLGKLLYQELEKHVKKQTGKLTQHQTKQVNKLVRILWDKAVAELGSMTTYYKDSDD